ncbi:hypothetical protein [Natrialba aegyptia]|uniref:Uncharacterized protein n=1 Tax=Natrialba aegyptia DSM 13077 TaxID=1227491 RepID=M0B8C2_9EURY|nr:hypothetical protein [Natrialba aegyptia]ELZ07040.1 hypothetical protein C480_08452 [Natrialba aegyptia DSM 13077]
MNRRQQLAQLGGVGLAALAGCLDTFRSDDATVVVADRTGQRALDRAIGRLNEVAIELGTQTDETFDRGVQESTETAFDPTPYYETIDTARSALDTAATELEADRQPDVKTGREYADSLEELVSVTATVSDDELSAEIEEVGTVFEGAGEETDDTETDLEQATTTIEDRTALLDEAQTTHETARTSIDGLDEDRFEALPTIDLDRLTDGLSTLGTILDAQTALAGSYGDLLDGYAALEAGREFIDDGGYQEAEASFVDAESAFTAGRKTVAESRDEAPTELAASFETAHCQSSHLQSAAAAFTEAAAAADNGNYLTAREYQDEADEALAAAGDCGDQ